MVEEELVDKKGTYLLYIDISYIYIYTQYIYKYNIYKYNINMYSTIYNDDKYCSPI